MNEHYEMWLEHVMDIHEMVISTEQGQTDGFISPAYAAGAVTLSVTIGGALLLKQPHPAGKALGAALIALPDPVVYSVAYSFLS